MKTNFCMTIMLIGLVFVTAIPVTTMAGELAEEEKIMAEPFGPEGPWPNQQFEMPPEHIEQILQQIREDDPQRADELVRLREQDPDAFMAELHNIAREHFQKAKKESSRSTIPNPPPLKNSTTASIILRRKNLFFSVIIFLLLPVPVPSSVRCWAFCISDGWGLCSGWPSGVFSWEPSMITHPS